jgi:hypothetical protein
MTPSNAYTTFQNRKPIYFLRIAPIACAVILILGLTVFKDGSGPAFCIGLVVGILVSVTVTAFQIRSIELTDTTQPTGTRIFPTA